MGAREQVADTEPYNTFRIFDSVVLSVRFLLCLMMITCETGIRAETDDGVI